MDSVNDANTTSPSIPAVDTDSPGGNETEQLYLIDMSKGSDNLERIIAKENVATTTVYCFCNAQTPKVPLIMLQKYSEWLQKKKLFIISPALPPQQMEHQSNESATAAAAANGLSYTLSYWIGKLTTTYLPKTTRIFIASEDVSLYNVVLALRQDGYEVGSNWPDRDSVQCTDDILCTVLKIIQQTDNVPLPGTLDAFTKYLRSNCHLPPYISLESVIRQLQQKGFISLHRGTLQYDFPVFLDAASTSGKQHARQVPNRSKSTARNNYRTSTRPLSGYYRGDELSE